MLAKRQIVTAEAIRLLRPFWPLVLLATVAGVLGGLATAWLLAMINDALHRPGEMTIAQFVELALLIALSVVGTGLAGTVNSALGQKIIAALRKDVAGRILQAPIAALESYRLHRLMTVLTSDIDTVSAFTFSFSGYAIAAAIVLGSFAYLLVLSPAVFVVALISLGAGVAVNLVAKRGWIRDYEQVRTAQDELQKQYRAISEGAKELKINRERRLHVYGRLLSGAADRIASLKIRAMRLFWMADAMGSAIFFVVIALLLASRHALDIDAKVISGAVVVLLYVKGPMEQLAAALPVLDQAKVSLQRIAQLAQTLNAHEPDLIGTATGYPPLQAVDKIALRGVIYAFPPVEGAEAFTVGPLDLNILAGELLFIVGENGSGKTTLVKLLLGLYEPQQGEILLNGVPVKAQDRDDYRQLFTTVFSDYYLFDDLVYGSALPEEALPYLKRLDLAHKVSVRDGVFSTTDLSGGQKKRLALVHAYLENRPIVVFDEWAADQDPSFRDLFYMELLPELKAQGKTLIVISHDDRYFHIADRLVRLDGGKIRNTDTARDRTALVPASPAPVASSI